MSTKANHHLKLIMIEKERQASNREKVKFDAHSSLFRMFVYMQHTRGHCYNWSKLKARGSVNSNSFLRLGAKSGRFDVRLLCCTIQ